MKIFLSHSSADKDIVQKVYEELGAGICHYDVATFDPVGFLPEQIYEAISESTHFVLFASDKALNSSWVQGELKTLFINWMTAKTGKVLVFLLRGGERSQVPAWLQSYIITEHPTPTHISCRILSEYDRWQDSESNIPPFYRTTELKSIESRLIVEAAKMPSCMIISGPDGFGRKEMINQVFNRIFKHIPTRKILIQSESFDSDVDLYKSLKGLASLMTARDLVAAVTNYQSQTLERRIDELAMLIHNLCNGTQTVILNSADSILNDAGEISAWLEQLINKLPQCSHPLLNITSNRRPNYIRSNLNDKLVSTYLEPLSDGDSLLLFRWWLNKLDVSLPDNTFELVLEQVSGNPKLIEESVKLLKNIADLSDIRNIKRHVFSDLERNSSTLLSRTITDNLSKLILALIVDCGQISIVDLITVVAKVTSQDTDVIVETCKKLDSYGFVQNDSQYLTVPKFLLRAARVLGKTEIIAGQLKDCWSALADQIKNITLDDETSVAVLNEACMIQLKQGVNTIYGIESLILPSQCLRTARYLYDSNNYEQSYTLSKKAFEGRLALTDEGAIEALRFRGMSAARLNSADLLSETLECFKEFAGNTRAQRIAEFTQGFDFRLAGKYDLALTHMIKAVNLRGEQDIHVLRELAFLYLSSNEPQKAKVYINKAVSRVKSNSYISELQILTELAFGKEYVAQNQSSILDLIEGLDSTDTSPYKSHAIRTKVEYLIVIGSVSEARALFNKAYSNVMHDDATPKRLLEAKLLIAEKKYYDALRVLSSTKKKILDSKDSQRRSILPIVADLLIQASSSISIPNAITEFKANEVYLPKSLLIKVRQEIVEIVSYSKQQLNAEDKKTLGLG